uniref:T9SS type A sorting domain-containing protein n=1 Tax=candidate division WOR-3 bacterium TaxID=2052148 RepID=A0A7V3VU39_UNCW3
MVKLSQLLIVLCTSAMLLCAGLWIETTQEDFADGIYERNIYASNRNNGVIEFVQSCDLDGNGYIDLFTAGHNGPIYIYWGRNTGYNPADRLQLYLNGGGSCNSADLNLDGYPDFVVSPQRCYFMRIYWGTPSGPDPNNYQQFSLPDYGLESNFIADLNKDGFLDIIVDTYTRSRAIVYWGSKSGFSPGDTSLLPTGWACNNIEVADYNKDGWLDICFANVNGGYNYLYWGSANGYSPSNCTYIPCPPDHAHGISTADLDNNGYLDLVFTGFENITKTYIWWGSASGFTDVDTLLTGQCYGGSAVADFNNDNYLDLVFFRGSNVVAMNPVIYWGSATGYSNSKYTTFGIAVNGSGGIIADFNQDGALDVFCNSYSSNSYIFWGPALSSYTALPVNYDHHGMFREIGNVYNRKYYEDYISSVFDANSIADWGTIEWDASTPPGSSVLFWLRSGNTPTPDNSWTDWIPVTNAGSIPENLNARYLQYKARLAFTNPAYLPSLAEVRISYATAGIIPATVRIEPEVINLKSHGKFTAFITLPPGYNHSNIDLSTVECEGAHAISGHATPEFYIAKFNIQDLVGVIPGPAVEFRVNGKLYDGTDFSGVDTVRVIGSYAISIICTPNPFSKRTTINFSYFGNKQINVKIYNTDGQLIRRFDKINSRNGFGSITWDRKDNQGRVVPAGVYLYQIEDGQDTYTEKIVVVE